MTLLDRALYGAGYTLAGLGMLAGVYAIVLTFTDTPGGCPPIFAEPAEGDCLREQIARRSQMAFIVLPAIAALIGGAVSLLIAERRATLANR